MGPLNMFNQPLETFSTSTTPRSLFLLLSSQMKRAKIVMKLPPPSNIFNQPLETCSHTPTSPSTISTTTTSPATTSTTTSILLSPTQVHQATPATTLVTHTPLVTPQTTPLHLKLKTHPQKKKNKLMPITALIC